MLFDIFREEGKYFDTNLGGCDVAWCYPAHVQAILDDPACSVVRSPSGMILHAEGNGCEVEAAELIKALQPVLAESLLAITRQTSLCSISPNLAVLREGRLCVLLDLRSGCRYVVSCSEVERTIIEAPSLPSSGLVGALATIGYPADDARFLLEYDFPAYL